MRVGLHVGFLVLGVAAVLTAMPGFEHGARTAERGDARETSAPEPKRFSDEGASGWKSGGRPVAESHVDELLETFNADLGEEGVPVGRQELERALQTDPELRDALLE